MSSEQTYYPINLKYNFIEVAVIVIFYYPVFKSLIVWIKRKMPIVCSNYSI